MEVSTKSSDRRDQGVYFARTDYLGFWRRLLIDVVDVGVVAMLSVVLGAVVISLPLPSRSRAFVLWTMLIGLWFSYFVLLKRSAWRTLGYRFGRGRIVSISGDSPSVWQLTLRLAFVIIGPVNLLFDLLFITSDEHRQAIRDKFAATYVVKSWALPKGRGRILISYYHIMGTTWLFREVKPDATEAAT